MNYSFRRILSLTLTLMMLISCFPVSAFATNDCVHGIQNVSETAATCTTDGAVVTSCFECGEVLSTEIIPAGHSYSGGSCSACGEADPNYIPEEDVAGDGEVDSDASVLTTVGEGTEVAVVTTEAELAAAIAAGGDIQLGADIGVATMIAVPAGVIATLDLAGYAITSGYQTEDPAKHIYPFDVYGDLTIMDSSAEQTGSITGRGIYVQDGSKLTLNSGSIYGIDSNGGSALFQYGGDIVIEGGHVEQKAEGTSNFAINAAAGTVTVDGGWVGGNHGAIATGGAVVVINDGEFVCTGSADMTDNVLYSYGTGSITIEGGEFVGDADAPSGGCCIYDANGGVTVNDGDFSKSSGGDVWGTTGTTINGGTFENLIETQHVTVGATITNGGETYTKTETGLAKLLVKIGENSYASLADAITAANGMTGEVVVDVYGEVEFVDGMELKGGYDSITFNGKADGAKITINQTAGGDYLEAHGKTVAFNGLTLAKANAKWADNSGHMGNYFSIQGGTVVYTDCTFPNGACTSGGTATYNNCTFQNAAEYGLWVYDDALVTVNGGTIDSKKGIKVYSENESSVTSTLTVQNATFTANVTEKPAVAIGYAESITLIGNTYNNTTGVLELDSGSDADCEGVSFVAEDTNGNDISKTITAVDRSGSKGACGVLVDGKIYTTAATAAEAAVSGSTVTLLHNSDEEVKFAEGVILDKNNYTADKVTVAAPVEVDTYDELVAALAAGDSVVFVGDITATGVIDATDAKIDLNNNTLTLADMANNNFFGTSTVENGTISIEGVEVGGDCIVGIGSRGNDATLNLENVNVTGSNYSSAFGVFMVYGNGVLNINGGKWNLSNEQSSSGGVLKNENGAGSAGTINISGTEMTLVNVSRGITGSTAVLDGVNMTITGGDNGINGAALTVKNSTLSITGGTGRALTVTGSDVVIENSALNFANNAEADILFRSAINLRIDATSSLNTCNVAVETEGAAVNGNAVTGTADSKSTVSVANGSTTVKNPVTGLSGEGTEASPYIINNVDELKFFRDDVNSGSATYNAKNVYVQLNADIDLANEAWTPIGTSSVPFVGVFDGGSNTISNLKVSGGSHIGFFGKVSGGTLKNINIANVDLGGVSYLGAVVGMGYTGAIDNCHVSGDISIVGNYMIGGINGHGYAKISNCSVIGGSAMARSASVGVITGIHDGGSNEGDNVGGIVGHNGENNDITNCTVKNMTITGTRKVGGIVGIANMSSDITGCVLENVTVGTNATADYANANLKTMSIGGLVGQYQASGSNGSVSGNTISGLTFTNENNVTVSAGTLTGGMRGTDSVVAPTGALSSGNSIANVSGANVDYLFVATIGNNYYDTLQEAVNAANGATVTLIRDVTLSETLKVASGAELTLDLNGKTISQSKACTASYSMIENKGSLTITGNGKISFTDTGAGDPNAGWGSYTIHNAGTLVVENGTIENLSAQNEAGKPFAHTSLAIFQYSGSTTINGGTISTPSYRSARLWSGDMTINGGELDGQVWVHCVNDTSKLTITGGSFSPNGNDGSSVFVNNTGYKSELSITGGTFATKIGANDPEGLGGALISGGNFSEAAVIAMGDDSKLLGEGYVFEKLSDGSYGIKAANEAWILRNNVPKFYGTLEDAIADAKPGEVVILVANVTVEEIITVDKNVTISDYGTLTVSFTGNGAIHVTGNNELTLDNVKIDAPIYADTVEAGAKVNGEVIKGIESEKSTVTYDGTDFTLTNPEWAAQVGTTYYMDPFEAIKAAVAGDTVSIFAGDYTGNVNVDEGIEVVGEQDASGNNLVSFSGKLNITGNGAAVKGINVNNGGSSAGYINAKDVLVEDCSVVGGNGFRYCYTTGNVTFKDSTITGGTYGIHFDGSEGGNIVIENCDITGWTSFAGAITGVSIKDTEFLNGNYDKLRFYQNATLENVSFNPEMSIDFGKDDVDASFEYCTVSDGSDLKDVIYLPDIAKMGVDVTIDGEPVVVVAIIGEDECYETIDAAFEAVESGETITIYSDVSMTKPYDVKDMTLTIDGNCKLDVNNMLNVHGTTTLNIRCPMADNNGDNNCEVLLGDGTILKDSTINGDVFVKGKVTFSGDNSVAMLYDYGELTDYYGAEAKMEWSVENGGSLTVTNKARYGLGYGDSVTITGELTDATTARDTLTQGDLSLFMHGLVAQESTGWNQNSSLTVEDAYVQIGSNNSFGNKPGNYGGSYTFDFDNTVVDSSRITFYEANSTTEFNFTNSDVKTGTFMTRDADSVFTLENTKLLSTAATNGTDEGNYHKGTLNLTGSELTYSAPLVLENGTINLDVASCITAPAVTGTGKIVIDATGIENDATFIDADMSGFTGEVEVKGAVYEKTEEGLVVKKAAARIGDVYYASLAETIAAVGAGDVVIELLKDAELSYGARTKYGTDETTSLTIKGNDKTLNLYSTNTDWSSIGLKNADAKLILNNMTIDQTRKGGNGSWNNYAINFTSNLEMSDVVVNRSMSVEKGATLNNVTINEEGGYYGLWIKGNGQTVTINGGTINATNGGRGIKIADEYVDDVDSVTLTVDGMTFNTAKKAAVLVSSTAGAKVTANNCDITKVAEDSTNFVWVDEDWAEYNFNVKTYGEATKAQEGEFLIVVKNSSGTVRSYFNTLDELFASKNVPAGNTIELLGDVEAENKVNVSYNSNRVYSFVTDVAGGVTMNFKYADNWNNLPKFDLGENITMNVPYLYAIGGDIEIAGTINTNYLYLYGTGEGVTITETGVVNANVAEDKTVQVKGGTVLTVKGQLNTNTLNVWTQDVNNSELIVSGEKAEVNTSQFHAWNGKDGVSAQKVVVENGATLTAANFQADRGSEVTVDGAKLSSDKITLGYGDNVGTLNAVNGAEIELTNNGTLTVAKNSSVDMDDTVVTNIVASIIDANGEETFYTTFEDAFAELAEGCTLKLYSDVELAKVLTIKTANVTIDGNDKTITQSAECTNEWALLYFEGAGAVTVKNATFDGIKGGAVVRTLDTDISIDNVVFQNCEHTQIQGLVRLTRGDASITNSKFLNNSCTMAVSFNFDVENADDDKLVVDNCVFEGNTCSGTAVVYYVDGAGATITDSQFVKNTVNTSGNAATVYLGFTENNVVTGNLFKENSVTATSKRAAGAIMIGNAAVITGNAFDNNSSNAPAQDVCASTYYGEIDLSGNYWSEDPNNSDVIYNEYAKNPVVINNYFDSYSFANGALTLGDEIVPAYVAAIGDFQYTSLQAAVNAAKAGETVVVLTDLTPEKQIVINKAITLDLGGNTITGTGAVYRPVKVAGGNADLAVTITNGTIETKNVTTKPEQAAALLVYEGADVTLKDVKLIGTNYGVLMAGNEDYAAGVANNNVTSLYVNEGTEITADNAAIIEQGAYPNTYIEINAGTITSTDSIAIYLPTKGERVISGGEITGTTGIVVKAGELTVNGGTIAAIGAADEHEFVDSGAKSTGDAIVVESLDYGGYGAPVVSITGGTVKSENGKALVSYAEKNYEVVSKIVSGGTFSSEVKYCADGFVPTENADGTYGVVVANEVVAVIGEMSFDSVADAVAAATAGDTIKLVADANIAETVIVDENVNIDLNGHKITSDGNNSHAFRIAADVTVENGTIEMTDGGYCFIIGYNTGVAGKLTIKSGTYKGNTSLASVTYGTLNIEGGYFSVDPYGGEGYENYNFMFNCVDRFYKSGDAVINITGGSFENYNPADNASEGVGTNFVVNGYEATTGNGVVWNVSKAYVAEVNGKAYTSVEAAVAAANGETVKIIRDFAVDSSIVITEDAVIDLNEHSISATKSLSSAPVIRVLADVTIGNGIVNGTTGINSYAFIVGNSETAGTLTIEEGSYIGVTSAVSITNGTANITAGYFAAGHDDEGTDYGSKYLLNCMDSAYNAGKAVYNITGGYFEGFNPEDNLAEGAGTNFCAEGYMAVGDPDGNYTVIVDELYGKVAEVKGTYYETVTAAINAAEDGDTVLVLPGVVDEYIAPWAADTTHKSEKSITLIGSTDEEGNLLTTLTGGVYLGYDDGHNNGKTITVENLIFNTKGLVVAGAAEVNVWNNQFKNITAGAASAGTANANAISVVGKDVNASINNNVIDTVAVAGINLRNTKEVNVDGNTISNTGHNSITIQNNSADGDVTITNNVMSNWGTEGEGRAVRSAGGDNVVISGNAMIHTDAPEEFAKVTGNTDVYAAENYWNGTSPIQEGIFLSEHEGDPVDVLQNYYAAYVNDELTTLVELSHAVAKIGDKLFYALDPAVRAANDGDVIKLIADTEVYSTVMVDKNVTIDLNGFTAYAAKDLKNAPVMRILANVTVTNGAVDGTTGINSYAFIVGNNTTAGELTIADGEYWGVTSAISITNGKANISGGKFFTGYDGEGTDYGSKYLLNCMDDAYKAGNAVYNITGGTFVGFNPENNAAEGAGTNFLSDEYTVEEEQYATGPVRYTVAPAVAEYNGTKYTNLQAAVDAAVEAGTGEVVLLADCLDRTFADGKVTVKKNNFTAKIYAETGFTTIENVTAYMVIPASELAGEAGEAVAYIDADNSGALDNGETQTSLQAALNKAANGQIVRLVDNLKVDNTVIIPTGVTLDIQAYTLEVNNLIGLNGSKLGATGMKSNGVEGGRLVVAKDNLVLAKDAYTRPSDGYTVLPVWDADDELYKFAPIDAREWARIGHGLIVDTETMTISYKFRHYVTNYFKANLLNDGGSDNGIKAVIELSWNTYDSDGNVQGKARQTFEYTDALFAAINNVNNMDYTFKLGAYDKLEIDVESLEVCGKIVADCGIEAVAHEEN